MVDSTVSQLMQDVVTVYQILTRNRRRSKALMEINQGYCGIIASLVGNILIEHYNYSTDRIMFNSHCLHMWLTVDGVDYDTLYPNGYTNSVVDEWLLPSVNYATSILKHEFVKQEWDFTNAFDYFPYALVIGLYSYLNLPCTIKQPVITGPDRRKSNRTFNRLKLIHRPFKMTEQGTQVRPFTHYWHGEFEDNCNRILRPKPTDLRSCSKTHRLKCLRNLRKEYETNGIELTRL
jgi:hypothetical protein